MTKGIDEFLDALFTSEGGKGDDGYKIINPYGYVGKYQFGEDALADLGYFVPDGSPHLQTIPQKDGSTKEIFHYNWTGTWKGKNGINTLENFRNNTAVQDLAGKEWVSQLCKTLKHFKLQTYLGDTMGGVEITESGIIGAAHLKGFGNTNHPGVIQFLKSKGKIDATDANGTKVSSYMQKFSNYNLGCCGHLAIQVLDRVKKPVTGIEYEIRNGKKVIKKGKTDNNGATKNIVASQVGDNLSVWIKRVEGGFKLVSYVAFPGLPVLLTLISPKAKITAPLEQHQGSSGDYKRNSQPIADANATGPLPITKKRNIKGHPVAIAHAETTNKELSGIKWCEKFPTSKSLNDLKPAFKTSVTNFITALKTAGAKVRIGATYRPKERVYLMHYCCKVASGSISPEKVPAMNGVDIEWVHRDSDGKVDINASRQASKEMMEEYEIVYPAALSSRHTQRRAIDMTITNYIGKFVTNGVGKSAAIDDAKRLHVIGASYGVVKLIKDKPHWSDDGH